MKINNQILSFLLLSLLVTGCSDGLNSSDGPKQGFVSGIVCNELPVLAAALEFPVTRSKLLSEGNCLNLNKREQVNFIRTVMMPGDGHYSQFKITRKEEVLDMWIQTEKVALN